MAIAILFVVIKAEIQLNVGNNIDRVGLRLPPNGCSGKLSLNFTLGLITEKEITEMRNKTRSQTSES